MQEYTINELRKEIINALENYEGEPVVLDLPNCLLKQVLFDTTSDYLRFPNENSNFFKVLKKIDFSNVNFDGVYVGWQDLSQFKGISLNPQTINIKSLSGTKLNGVTITGSFEGVRVNCADFTGAKGMLEINPQEVYDKSLVSTVLNGVEFIGPFDGCDIRDADFTGSKGACIVINEFVLGNSNLQSNNFKDAQIYAVMTDDIKEKLVNIEGATIVEMISESEKEERIKQYCLTKIKNLGKK